MATAADRIKANAERLRDRTPAAADAPRRPPTAGTPQEAPAAIRQKSIRRTVDLAPAQHRALDVWQRETADQLGLARVTGQDVLSALVDQLLADPELSAHITRAIQARQ
ncbi:hypothetical protein QYF68_00805 [Mycolicibacterium austroafricanum]|uniref:ATPase n=1 Tax=Mycolicibacterium austroafricanum TaxID=39687 RepID=A0ABT8H6I0_MYCAO|nr:hypothetical protein [Mycolicibacterium austroafricanum]MDN4516367.1 hypothetical protein [Mycolicibacterium austroafricanum]